VRQRFAEIGRDAAGTDDTPAQRGHHGSTVKL
jgi:hypothetical protein